MTSEGAGAKRILSAVLGIALSIGLLLWAMRGVNLADVGARLRAAHTMPLFIATVIATATYPLRVFRWLLLLRRDDDGPLSAMPLWHAVAIGFMANNILPFRAGELVRVFAAARLTGSPFGTVLSSVAVERIFDGLAVVALLAIGLIGSDLPAGVTVGGVSVARAAQTAGLLAGLALIAAMLVVAFPLAAEGLVRRALPTGRITDRIVSIIEGIRLGLTALRSPSRLAGVVCWSLVIWMLNAFAFYVAFAAFDIPVSYAGALVLQGVLVVGISVQFSPGFVGQFEAAIVAALALYGVRNDVASSYAIAYHTVTFLPIVLLGFWSLARSPVAIGDLRRTPA
ncbi:MAG: lysylphosphatidylglycerol synthase transmembrane domain-containing protein [Gemmatimonadales bacterium]